MRIYRTFILLALSIAVAACGSIGPDSLIRQHAYSGPKQSKESIATVYGQWGAFSGAMVFICEVDGKSYTQLGAISPCPSVVYLQPGEHEVSIDWRWAGKSNTQKVKAVFEPGKVYEAVAIKNKNNEVDASIASKPADFVLTYKEFAPSFFADGKRQDSVVDPATAK